MTGYSEDWFEVDMKIASSINILKFPDFSRILDKILKFPNFSVKYQIP